MTIAGTYGRRSLDASGDHRQLVEALGTGDRQARILSAGPLAAACAGASTGSSVEAEGVDCLWCGSLYRLEAVARELDADPNQPVGALLATAYRRWGLELLDRLRGEFCLLAWDRRTQTGLLAGDQMGMGAIFYADRADGLIFASEVRPVLALLPSTPAPDRHALVQWLAGSGREVERTMYEGVRRLGGGHALILEDNRSRRVNYWRPQYRPPRPRPRAELVDGLRAEVDRAVRERMGSTPRPGLIISGGIDSSIVAAAARDAADDGAAVPPTYSGVFPADPDVDESEAVRALTEALRLPNRAEPIPPRGTIALSLDYLARWRVPLDGPGYIVERPLLGSAAQDGVTALLDGQGGDELFGLAPYLVADYLRRGRVRRALELARRVPGAGRSRRMLYLSLRYYGVDGLIPHRVHRWRAVLRGRPRDSPGFLSDAAVRLLLEVDDPWSWKRVDGPRWWANLADLLTTAREEVDRCDYLRRRADQAGMSARPPLFDLDLVQFVLELPPEASFDAAFDRPLARESMAGRVPDSVRLSTRKSNLAPVYLAALVADMPALRRLLAPGETEIHAYVRPEEVGRLLDRPPAVGDSHWMWWPGWVWRLATAECWLRAQADPAFPVEAQARLGFSPARENDRN